ncbi:hypothetical protein GEMRC1_006143 [Eukaryota sp. GEM-RC1]
MADDLSSSSSESDSSAFDASPSHDHPAPLLVEPKQPTAGGLYTSDYSDFLLAPFTTTDIPDEPEIDSIGNVNRLHRDDVWLEDSAHKLFTPPLKKRNVESESQWKVTDTTSDDDVPRDLVFLLAACETPKEAIIRWVSAGYSKEFEMVTEYCERLNHLPEIMYQLPCQICQDYTVVLKKTPHDESLVGPLSLPSLLELHEETGFNKKEAVVRPLSCHDAVPWMPLAKVLKKMEKYKSR